MIIQTIIIFLIACFFPLNVATKTEEKISYVTLSVTDKPAPTPSSMWNDEDADKQSVPACAGDQVQIICDHEEKFLNNRDIKNDCELWKNDKKIQSENATDQSVTIFNDASSTNEKLGQIDIYVCKLNLKRRYDHSLVDTHSSQLIKVKYFNCSNSERFSTIVKKTVGRNVKLYGDYGDLDNEQYYQSDHWYFYGRRLDRHEIVPRPHPNTTDCHCCEKYLSPGTEEQKYLFEQYCRRTATPDEHTCRMDCLYNRHDTSINGFVGIELSNISMLDSGIYERWSFFIDANGIGNGSDEISTAFRSTFDLHVIESWTGPNWINVINITNTSATVTWPSRYERPNRFGMKRWIEIKRAYKIRLMELSSSSTVGPVYVTDQIVQKKQDQNNVTAQFTNLKPYTLYTAEISDSKGSDLVFKIFVTADNKDKVVVRVGQKVSMICANNMGESSSPHLRHKWTPWVSESTVTNRKIDRETGAYIIERFSGSDVGEYTCRITYDRPYIPVYYDRIIELALPPTHPNQPAKPSRFSCSDRNASSIMLNWSYPEVVGIKFKIIYTSTNQFADERKYLEINGSARSITLEQLLPETSYAIEMVASTDIADSERVFRLCATIGYLD